MLEQRSKEFQVQTQNSAKKRKERKKEKEKESKVTMEVRRLFVRHSEMYLTNCRQPSEKKREFSHSYSVLHQTQKRRKREMK